nr:hypothetical protein [Nostoc sp. DedQUE02]
VMALSVKTMALSSETMALSSETIALSVETMALSVETMALSVETIALSVETIALSYHVRQIIHNKRTPPCQSCALSPLPKSGEGLGVGFFGFNKQSDGHDISQNNGIAGQETCEYTVVFFPRREWN